MELLFLLLMKMSTTSAIRHLIGYLVKIVKIGNQ